MDLLNKDFKSTFIINQRLQEIRNKISTQIENIKKDRNYKKETKGEQNEKLTKGFHEDLSRQKKGLGKINVAETTRTVGHNHVYQHT